MIRLEKISAVPDPGGNEIILNWINPVESSITGVHVRRGLGTHPVSLDDGITVTVASDQQSAVDTGLKGDTVYYYSLFPYQGDPSNIDIDRHNRASALAISPMGYANYMYDLLPKIYHRYDTVLSLDPGSVDIDLQTKGQLYRFLHIIGGQLDVMHGYATASLNFRDLQQVDGNMLPLLAAWIGWKLDQKRELKGQRNEIRNAPALYNTIGIIPALQHTVKRISNWESSTKEFVHNVFLSNRPEKLNIWQLLRNNIGAWSSQPKLFSMDYAYDGRPVFTIDNHQLRWLFYHTQRNGRWEIWYKTSPYFELDVAISRYLVVGTVDDAIRTAFQLADIDLSVTSAVTQLGNIWRLDDTDNSSSYLLVPDYKALIVFQLTANEAEYSPSKALIRNSHINKYPSSVLHGEILWLFWSEFNEDENEWHIHYRLHADGDWSDIDPSDETSPFRQNDVVDELTPRFRPNAVIDRLGNLWLFWLEWRSQVWQVKYNRWDGSAWEPTAVAMPAASLAGLRIDADPYVLMAELNTGPQIYLFWSRNIADGSGGESRWHIEFAVKSDLAFDAANWHGIYSLPKNPVDDNYHDREPSVLIDSTGHLDFYWSSNRDGNWSVWHRTLDSVDTATDIVNWGAEERITQSVYSCREPVATMLSDDRVLLLFRSNESIRRGSQTYEAMETFDSRFAGSTTMHMRNLPKRELTGKYDDFQTYTIDIGQQGKRDDNNWYARDTIGLYLKTDTLDEETINHEITRLRSVVTEFIPITDRAVYINQGDSHSEYVYAYEQPQSPGGHYIVSTYTDEFTSGLAENVLNPEVDFTDSLE